MLEETGIPEAGKVEASLPSRERLEQGPGAVFECFTEIPCDPCYYSCPIEAIAEFHDINDLPELDFEKCTGCGQCISNCPGLAIFVLDYNYREEKGVVRVPYEYSPLPEEGEIVQALDRTGEVVGEARVERVQNAEKQDRTAVIWLAVPKEQVLTVRNFERMED